MNAWIVLIFFLAVGVFLGGVLSALYYRAKLKLYKRFVQSHLDATNSSLMCPVLRAMPDVVDRLRETDHEAK